MQHGSTKCCTSLHHTFQYPIQLLYSWSVWLVQLLKDVDVFELAAVLELLSAKEHHSNEVPLAANDLV